VFFICKILVVDLVDTRYCQKTITKYSVEDPRKAAKEEEEKS
jgi:hypothetical protein